MSILGVVALAALTACSGTIGDAGPGIDAGPRRPSDPWVEPEPEPPLVDPGRTQCEGRFHTLRRLTPEQHVRMLVRMFARPDDRSVRGLVASDFAAFRGPSSSPQQFAFENDAVRTSPSPDDVAKYQADAWNAAEFVVTRSDAWITCDSETEPSCVIDTLLRLASVGFRRPLTEGDRAAFRTLVETLRDETAASVLTFGIYAILESPEFIYLTESGDPLRPAGEGSVYLQKHELAHRLALFLWDELADDVLIARIDELEAMTSEPGYSALVDEMLDDPRVERGLERFFTQWMPLTEQIWFDTGSLQRDVFTRAPASLSNQDADRARRAVRDSALRSFRHAFLEGSLEDLFAGRVGFVNDHIAFLFGVPAPGSAELVQVELPADERAGILTHPAVLGAVPRDATFPSVLRAVAIMSQVTCEEPGQPDFSLITTASEEVPWPSSARDSLEEAHLGSGCGGTCHHAIDGLGFPFEQYDRIGRFRTHQKFLVDTYMGQKRPCMDSDGDGFDDRNGGERMCVVEQIEIDPSGRVLLDTGTESSHTDVDDVVELAERLGQSERAKACFIKHLYGFAIGRTSVNDFDLAVIADIAESLSSDSPLRGLARRLTMSEEFRTMPACSEDDR